jgi:putative oxidoreductase
MDIGLLALRVLTALLLAGHATQKLFGWCSGMGPDATGVLFEKWGHRPGKPMAVLAGACELTGGSLLAFGLLTPLGAAMVTGTMLVAATALSPQGLWAAKGGSELPLVYGIVAGSLAFIGPGSFALDRALGLHLAGTGWGLAALACALTSAGAALARRRLAPAPVPT